jgi:hypothetical protein
MVLVVGMHVNMVALSEYGCCSFWYFGRAVGGHHIDALACAILEVLSVDRSMFL